MPKIVAFEIEIGGVKEVFKNFDDVKNRVKALKAEFAKADFGTDKYKQAQIALAKLSKVQDDATAKTRQYKQEVDATSKSAVGSYRQLNAELVLLRKRFKDISAVEREGKLGQQLTREITVLDAKLKSIDSSIGLFQRNVGNYAGAIQGALANAGNLLGGGVAGAGVSGIANIAGSLTLGPAAAFAALGLAASQTVSAMGTLQGKISDLQAGIRKTSGLSAESVNALTEELKGIDTRSSLESLLDIGRVLGQLGVEVNTGTITAIDRLNVALGDEFTGGATEITTVIGKLKNIFVEFKGVKPEEAFLNIGNALNVLGASGIATAPVVADFASRIGGQLGQLGLKAGDVLGVSAAMEELGITVERGGSSFGRVLQQIAETPDKFRDLLGISGEVVGTFTDGKFQNFTDLINNDLFAAFQLVTEQINKLNLSNTQRIKLFNELKIKNVGEIEVLGKLSQSSDLFKSRVEASNKAIKEQSSITQEFAIVNNTLGGALEKVQKSMELAFLNTGITTGINTLLQGYIDLVKATDSHSQSLIAQKANMQSLVAVVLDINTSEENRIRVIKELQAIYPEYLGGVDAEKITIGSLIGVMERLNIQYNERIRLVALTEVAQEASEKRTKAEISNVKAQADAYKRIFEFADRLRTRGISFDTTGSIEDLSKRLDQFGLTNTPIKLQGSLIAAKGAVISYNKSVIDAIQTSKEFAKQQESTNKVFEQSIQNKNITQASKNQAVAQKEKIVALAKEIELLNKQGKAVEANEKFKQLQFQNTVFQRNINIQQLKEIAATAKTVGNTGVETLANTIIGTGTEASAIVGSTQTLLKGNVAPPKNPDNKTKATAKALKDEADLNKKYIEERIKQLADFKKLVLENEVDAIADNRQKAIEQEKLKYQEQLDGIEKNTNDVLEKQKAAREQLAARAKSGNVNAQNALLGFDKKALVENTELLNAANDAKESFTVLHREKLLDINNTYDEQELRAVQEAQSKNIKALIDGQDKRLKEVNNAAKSRNQRNTRNKLSGLNLGLPTDQVNGLFDNEAAKITADSAKSKLDELNKTLLAANTLNSINAYLGLDPAVSAKDLQTLSNQVIDAQDELFNIQANNRLKEIDEIEKHNTKKEELNKKHYEELKGAAFDIASDIIAFTIGNEINDLKAAQESKIELLDKEYAKKKELAGDNAVEQERIDTELQQKKIKLDKEFQIQAQKNAIKQTIIQGALAVVKAYATSPDPISATIAAIGIAITTGLQVATIKKQKFARGDKFGFFGGKSHDKGGTQLYGSDGTNIEVERDEGWVVINKRNAPLLRKLSAINSLNGHGKKFADGGAFALPNTNTGTAVLMASVEFSDKQLDMLARRLEQAAERGTGSGAMNGIANGNRINERQAELRQRIN